MKLIYITILSVLLTLGVCKADETITLKWNNTTLTASPVGDMVVDQNNDLWDQWQDQSVSTPPIVTGMYTLYGTSGLAYGQVALRAADWEQKFKRRVAEHNSYDDMLVRLRGDGYNGFTDRLHNEGFDCVVATKSNDIGRTGQLWLYDDRKDEWQEPLSVIVMDAAGAGAWENLRGMVNPLKGVLMPWVLEIAKDCLEQRGLKWKVNANQSGFARVVFGEAKDRTIVWPE